MAALRSGSATDDDIDDVPSGADEDSGRRRTTPPPAPKPSLLLATGSADACTYIYDVSGREVRERA